MKKLTRCALAAVTAQFVCLALSAATFVIGPDRLMVQKAPLIVVATALASHAELRDNGAIETVTVMSIEEVLKGSIDRDTIAIHEPGGVYGTTARIIPGVPRFQDGQRCVLFLVHMAGAWRVMDMALGKFAFTTDNIGHELLVRDTGEIVGWDLDGTPHREALREATAFLDFIRASASGGPAAEKYLIPALPLSWDFAQATAMRFGGARPLSTFAPSTYTYDYSGTGIGARWNVFPSAVTFKKTNANSAADTAAANAIAAWNNNPGSNVNLVDGGADTSGTHNGGIDAADGQSTIAFESDLSAHGVGPLPCSSTSYGPGVLGAGGVTASVSTHSPSFDVTETFATATEGDVEMNKGTSTCGFFISTGDFNSAVTHELGHAIGFRHSDEGRTLFSGTACSTSTSECSSAAIMVGRGGTLIPTGLHGVLQTWDQDAAKALYPCAAPSITTQPASTSISSGQSTTLSVGVSASSTVAYQWYVGAQGVTTSPVSGGTSASLQISPTTTTTYWVRITGCGTSVDSNAATVTISACQIPVISVAPGACVGSTTNTAKVTVISGATYSWSITNGTITGGQGTSTITFQPTAAGAVNLQVSVTSTGCASTPSATVTAATCANSGDVNGNGSVNAADVFYLINTLFAGGPPVAGGTGDANNDGSVDAGDIIYLLRYLYAGGNAPH